MKLKKKIVHVNEKTTMSMLEEAPDILDEIASNRTKRILLSIDRLYNTSNNGNFENPTYKSVSVCCDGDIYCKKTGEDIACLKTDYKYHKAMSKKCNGYIAVLNKIINQLEEKRDVHIRKFLNIKNDLQNYGVDDNFFTK